MDQHLINIIIGLIVAVAGMAAKKSSKTKDADPDQTPPTPSMQQGQPVLTEADRRYREVQEEIRRRIAQKSQTAPGQPATMTPNPVPNYKPSAKSTVPINTREYQTMRRKAAAPSTPPPTLAKPAKPAAVQPVMAVAPAMDAPPSYPSEAAAYALPKESGDNAASSSTSPGGSNALRAILASPSAARQAFLLREIFAQPLGLRPMASGGHEDWN